MIEHLRMMSGMIRDLKVVGNVLSDEQQVQVVIRSLPDSWISMKQIMTHNENIKNFADISRHVKLEAESQEATKSVALIAHVGSANQMGLSAKTKARQQGRVGLALMLPKSTRVQISTSVNAVQRKIYPK